MLHRLLTLLCSVEHKCVYYIAKLLHCFESCFVACMWFAQLALVQTNSVISSLQSFFPLLKFEIGKELMLLYGVM